MTNTNDTRKNATARGNRKDVIYTIKMLSYEPIDDVDFVQEAKTLDRYEYLCLQVDLEKEGARFDSTTVYETDTYYCGVHDEVVTVYDNVHNNYEETIGQPTWFSYDSYTADSHTHERITTEC